MKTEQIITNVLFMPGYREVRLGGGADKVIFRLGGDFGSFFAPDDGTLPMMSILMTSFSQGRDYLTIRHWPNRKGRSVVYRFLPVYGDWVPLSEEAVRHQLARKKVKNCEPAVMED